MKRFARLNLILIITLSISLLSCSHDDDSSTNMHELIGVWQRSDSNANLDYKLTFLDDNSGTRISYERNGDQEVSSIIEIYWSTIENQLTLILNEEINTEYSFNVDGQLIISGLSPLPFNRLE